MGFPDDSLTADEHVVLHLHPHWKAMIGPTFWTVVAGGGVIAASILFGSETAAKVGLIAVGAVALALFLWLAFWPFLVWRSTHFVFTNERVLLRQGVFNREQRDIPLARVNDVSSRQSLQRSRCSSIDRAPASKRTPSPYAARSSAAGWSVATGGPG